MGLTDLMYLAISSKSPLGSFSKLEICLLLQKVFCLRIWKWENKHNKQKQNKKTERKKEKKKRLKCQGKAQTFPKLHFFFRQKSTLEEKIDSKIRFLFIEFFFFQKSTLEQKNLPQKSYFRFFLEFFFSKIQKFKHFKIKVLSKLIF